MQQRDRKNSAVAHKDNVLPGIGKLITFGTLQVANVNRRFINEGTARNP